MLFVLTLAHLPAFPVQVRDATTMRPLPMAHASARWGLFASWINVSAASEPTLQGKIQ